MLACFMHQFANVILKDTPYFEDLHAQVYHISFQQIMGHEHRLSVISQSARDG